MQSHARVVIVGGGMMGCGLLYHLAKEGWTDAVLIEKGELTSGSTWHAAGQCPSFIGSYNMAKIHNYGHRLYPQLEAETGQYVGWHGCGGIRFAVCEEELDWFKYVKGLAPNIGFRMEIIDPAEIQKINPFVMTDGVLAGAYTFEDGHVDPAGCCNALAIGARNMGATIYRRNRVTDIKQHPDDTWEVVTEQGSIRAEHVVNAAGCYAREIAQMVGADAPITNMQHQYLVTETIPEFAAREEEMPVMRDPYTAGYYRQEQKGGLIGIYQQTGVQEAWPEGVPWEAESELFEPDLDRLSPWLERAMERIPIFATVGVKRVVNGAIPHSPDGNPLLGPAADLRNFWMCCGSSIGIAQGAGCGKYLAQWMVHGQAEINMREFDPRRFGSYADQAYTRAKSFEDYVHMFIPHLPGEELPAGRPSRTTPLYDELEERGAVHTEAFGWERPKWFSPDGQDEEYGFRRNNAFDPVASECAAVRERVGVLDLSGFAKYDVAEPDAEAFLNRICANRVARRDGGIVLAHMLTPDGMIESEVTITRLAPDRFYVLSSALSELRDLDMFNQARRDGEKVTITNVTDDYGILVVVGPKSRDVLRKLTEADLGNNAFPWLTAQEIDVAGVPARALRVNYVGELGWELHHPMDRIGELYDAIWTAGQDVGIANFGVYAMNSLRMEKAYRGWGSELTNEITMIEADMERFIKLDKGDFTGREALVKRKEDGIATKLVYLAVDAADADPLGGEPVHAYGRVIGVTTSGAYGHAVKQSLAFAYVEPELSAPGTVLEVSILDEGRSARVLEGPVYDPENVRLKA